MTVKRNLPTNLGVPRLSEEVGSFTVLLLGKSPFSLPIFSACPYIGKDFLPEGCLSKLSAGFQVSTFVEDKSCFFMFYQSNTLIFT